MRLGLGDGTGAAPVARLSTGERQRLALLRALAMIAFAGHEVPAGCSMPATACGWTG
ncbi:hypothetical protein [Magnetospirillum sp. 15-1]|uniref:hypothetical protein n=1 Tax=Magnetospirillum sp. 15-1 TaxID=1979370 RepID=UPI001481DDD0|nr:hypothetical protein [Magnetospirillum sp. 15-1]